MFTTNHNAAFSGPSSALFSAFNFSQLASTMKEKETGLKIGLCDVTVMEENDKDDLNSYTSGPQSKNKGGVGTEDTRDQNGNKVQSQTKVKATEAPQRSAQKVPVITIIPKNQSSEIGQDSQKMNPAGWTCFIKNFTNSMNKIPRQPKQLQNFQCRSQPDSPQTTAPPPTTATTPSEFNGAKHKLKDPEATPTHPKTIPNVIPLNGIGRNSSLPTSPSLVAKECGRGRSCFTSSEEVSIEEIVVLDSPPPSSPILTPEKYPYADTRSDETERNWAESDADVDNETQIISGLNSKKASTQSHCRIKKTEEAGIQKNGMISSAKRSEQLPEVRRLCTAPDESNPKKVQKTVKAFVSPQDKSIREEVRSMKRNDPESRKMSSNSCPSPIRRVDEKFRMGSNLKAPPTTTATSTSALNSLTKTSQPSSSSSKLHSESSKEIRNSRNSTKVASSTDTKINCKQSQGPDLRVEVKANGNDEKSFGSEKGAINCTNVEEKEEEDVVQIAEVPTSTSAYVFVECNSNFLSEDHQEFEYEDTAELLFTQDELASVGVTGEECIAIEDINKLCPPPRHQPSSTRNKQDVTTISPNTLNRAVNGLNKNGVTVIQTVRPATIGQPPTPPSTTTKYIEVDLTLDEDSSDQMEEVKKGVTNGGKSSKVEKPTHHPPQLLEHPYDALSLETRMLLEELSPMKTEEEGEQCGNKLKRDKGEWLCQHCGQFFMGESEWGYHGRVCQKHLLSLETLINGNNSMDGKGQDGHLSYLRGKDKQHCKGQSKGAVNMQIARKSSSSGNLLGRRFKEAEEKGEITEVEIIGEISNRKQRTPKNRKTTGPLAQKSSSGGILKSQKKSEDSLKMHSTPPSRNRKASVRWNSNHDPSWSEEEEEEERSSNRSKKTKLTSSTSSKFLRPTLPPLEDSTKEKGVKSEGSSTSEEEDEIIENKVKLYECEVCWKKFEIELDLAEHLFEHANQKSFDCDRCEASFARPMDLHRHIVALHREIHEPKIRRSKFFVFGDD